METSGRRSLSRTVTAARDGSPRSYSSPSSSASSTAASALTTASSRVFRRSAVVAARAANLKRTGVAAGDGDVPSIRMASIVKGAALSPARVRVNTASPPSVIRSDSAATDTTGESLRRI